MIDQSVRTTVAQVRKTAVDLPVLDDAFDAATKQPTAGVAAGGASVKKPKAKANAELQIPSEDMKQWKDWKDDGLLSKQKNDVLKDICKAFGVKVSGKKGELLERIEQQLLKY